MIKHAISRNIDFSNTVIYVQGCSMYCVCQRKGKIIKQCEFLGDMKDNENLTIDIKCKQ